MTEYESIARGTTRVSLVVLSETMGAGEMAALIGLEPDKAWDSGELRRPGHRQRFHGISIDVIDEIERDPEAQLDRLLARLDVAADRVAELADRPEVHSAKIWLHNSTPDNPKLSLAPAQLERLARLGVQLEFDSYFCPEDEED